MNDHIPFNVCKLVAWFTFGTAFGCSRANASKREPGGGWKDCGAAKSPVCFAKFACEASEETAFGKGFKAEGGWFCKWSNLELDWETASFGGSERISGGLPARTGGGSTVDVGTGTFWEWSLVVNPLSDKIVLLDDSDSTTSFKLSRQLKKLWHTF